MTEWPIAATLETARLTLEPLAPRHAAEMVAALAAPELYTFTGGEPPGEGQLHARYAAQSRGRSSTDGEGWLNWILRLRTSGRAIGYVQATVTSEHGSFVADVAWLVSLDQQRLGLAVEASTAMVAWLRQQGVTVLRACIHPDHRASARVAERLGFAPTAEVEDGEVVWAQPDRAAPERAAESHR